MDFQRLVLLAGLALVLMLLWQSWLQYDTERNPTITMEQEPIATDGSPTETASNAEWGNKADIPSVPSTPAASPSTSTAAPPVPRTVVESAQRVVVETDLLRVEIDTQGGDLRVLELLTYPVSIDKPEQPFRLLNDASSDLFLMQSGLLGSGRELPNHHTLFRPERLAYRLGMNDSVTATLEWSAPGGITYRKLYTFHRNSYFFDLRFEVDNASSEEWSGYLYGQLLRTEVTQKGKIGFLGRLPSYIGGAIYTPAEKYDKIKFGHMRDGNLSQRTSTGWVAMLQHYFVGAFLLPEASNYEFYSTVTDYHSEPRYHLGFKHLQPSVVAAGRQGSVDARLYVGPKEQQRLKTAAQKLELTVDYGWLTPLSSPLFWLMTYINKFFHNWGVSILLLTLLVKLAFYPLSAASYKSMARMKNLAPRMKTLKERYGDDKQKFQQEMMAIYKKEKVNPLGGCLPIVIQIPVFIALYWVLLESVELRQAPFALWLQDLSIPDPYFVLPILMGASMFGQQLLNPTPPDPMQAKIMMALPVVFTVFFLWFPAGLVLYWLANNVLSIAQQWYITRKIASAKT
jgi:YidC/Oxa1 family membrane protein insertase